MMNFFKRKQKQLPWNKLSDSQKNIVASRLSKTLKAMAGARYKIVTGSD